MFSFLLGVSDVVSKLLEYSRDKSVISLTLDSECEWGGLDVVSR